MKNNRQSMILDIIAKEHIETQEQLLEQLRDQALLLRSKGVQQMFRLQSVVLVLHSQLLRCLQSLQRFLRILIGIHKVKPPFIPEVEIQAVGWNTVLALLLIDC